MRWFVHGVIPVQSREKHRERLIKAGERARLPLRTAHGRKHSIWYVDYGGSGGP